MQTVFWTREAAIEAGNRFVRIEGRYPTGVDFRGKVRQDLPYEMTIRRLFGTVRAFVTHLITPAPRPILTRRPCNNCEALFTPRHRHLHSCDKCKLRDEWAETGDYLNGEVITWRA